MIFPPLTTIDSANRLADWDVIGADMELAKVDTQYDLNAQIVDATSRWALEILEASPALQSGGRP